MMSRYPGPGRIRLLVLASSLLVATTACREGDTTQAPAPVDRFTPQPSLEKQKEAVADERPRLRRETRWVTRRPPWLGKRVLPKGPGGFGLVRRTPPILRNRRFATIDIFAPPRRDRFTYAVGPVPRAVLERSTWRPKCPISVENLSYLRMSFWGFDRRSHTGEMIVNASVAGQVVDVFRALYRSRFPIEEMRVVSLREQRRQMRSSTGDTNMTSSFECRRATLGTSWSEHAVGLAIDINPFHNPYIRGELVGPELARAYTDRTWQRPGMIVEGDVVTRAFDAIGWGWGGRWSSLKDWMHFSQSGH